MYKKFDLSEFSISELLLIIEANSYCLALSNEFMLEILQEIEERNRSQQDGD